MILRAKSKVMLVCKKRRQRRESSEIGHPALHKKAGGEGTHQKVKTMLLSVTYAPIHFIDPVFILFFYLNIALFRDNIFRDMYLYFNLLTVDLREEFQSVTDHIKTTYTISLMTMVSAIELSRSAYLYQNPDKNHS